jgi:hypothetical protein
MPHMLEFTDIEEKLQREDGRSMPLRVTA